MSGPVALVVTFNSAAVIEACLKTLAGRRVVVVDNASQDDTLQRIRRASDATVIEETVNRGFAAGVNVGLRAIGRHDVLLINPDVRVQPGSIERLVQTLEDQPRAGVVAPLLRNPDGTPQLSARTFKTWTAVLARRTPWQRTRRGREVLERHLDLPDPAGGPAYVDWALGAAMLVRAAAIADVGPMDEGFFLYEEDVDWCARMWGAGWEVVYEPRAEMVHEYGRASRRAWDLRHRPTRAHWASLARLAAKYPGPFLLGRPVRPSDRSLPA